MNDTVTWWLAVSYGFHVTIFSQITTYILGLESVSWFTWLRFQDNELQGMQYILMRDDWK
jgi:hypothetical protein